MTGKVRFLEGTCAKVHKLGNQSVGVDARSGKQMAQAAQPGLGALTMVSLFPSPCSCLLPGFLAAVSAFPQAIRFDDAGELAPS